MQQWRRFRRNAQQRALRELHRYIHRYGPLRHARHEPQVPGAVLCGYRCGRWHRSGPGLCNVSAPLLDPEDVVVADLQLRCRRRVALKPVSQGVFYQATIYLLYYRN